MVHNGHLLAQSLQILLGDAQTRGKYVAGYGHHLLQDIFLAAQLLYLVEKLKAHTRVH